MPDLLTPPPAPPVADERLATLCAHVVAEAAHAPRARARRRGAVVTAAAAATCAAALAVALAPDDVQDRLVRTGVVPVVDRASALERAVRGLASGVQLVHVVTVYHASNGTLRTETWQAADGRTRVRQTFPDGTVLENRIDGEGRAWLDRERGVVVDHPWRTPDEEARVRRELAVFDLPGFLAAVRDGAIVDLGRGTFEGRSVARYERTDGADVTTFYLDPTTSLPRATWMRTRGTTADATLGLERYETFETVPADDTLLELEVPPGTPHELDLPPVWVPMREGEAAPASVRRAFADTASLAEPPPARPPIAERAVVARVVELGAQSQFVVFTAPVAGGGPPCFVVMDHDLEGDRHSPTGICPQPQSPERITPPNPSRDGRWWTIAGVVAPEVERVELRLGTRVVPLTTRGGVVADAVPAGAPDERVWLVITPRGGQPVRQGPKEGTSLAQFVLPPPPAP